MESELSSLESNINRLNAKSDKQKTEIVALQRRIKDQKRKLKIQQSAIAELDSAGGSAAYPERYRVLEQERDKLTEEYTKLLAHSQAVSNAQN
jgi:peptidoglycan hydrolase CwlO-like protein